MEKDNIKKILIIIAAFIAVIAIAIVIVKSNIFTKLFIKQTSKQQPVANQENKILPINAGVVISEKRERIALADCASAQSSSTKENCLQIAQINAALDNYDYKICDGLKDVWQDICVWRLTNRLTARGHQDAVQNCEKIKEAAAKDDCYLNAAINLNQEKICAKCTIRQDVCPDYVKEQNSQELSDCVGIKKENLYYKCVTEKSSDCSKLKDKAEIDRCQSWQLFDSVIASNKKEECAKFPLAKFKQVCEIFMDKGFIDSDADGGNNKEELMLGTDPFTFDKNINELKYGATQSIVMKTYQQTLNDLYDVMKNMKDKNIVASATSTVE